MGIGTGTWKLRAKFTKAVDKEDPEPIGLILNIYLDEDWDAAMEEEKCREKLKSAKKELTI